MGILDMKECLKMIKNMVKVYLHGHLVIIILEILLMIVDMVMEKCFGKINIIKDIGKEVCNMVMVNYVKMDK